MKTLSTFRQLEAIHDLRKKVALSKLRKERAEFGELYAALTGLESDLAKGDVTLLNEIADHTASLKDVDHYKSFAANISVIRIRHREKRMSISHRREKIQERIREVAKSVKATRKRYNAECGAIAKFEQLIEDEIDRLSALEDEKEESENSEINSVRGSLANA